MGELALLRRIAVVLVVGFAVAAGFVRLTNVYGNKFYDVTVGARWIWAPVDITRQKPVTFFATRDFDLPANRYFTKIKILGDPEYTLYFNGQEIAGRRVGDEHNLDVYDVSALSKTGPNRIVVAVRANSGVGGLIASVDISPVTENFVVTDASWRIALRWSPALLARDVGRMQHPMVIGEPPVGRWNYLGTQQAAIAQPPSVVRAPISSFNYTAAEAEVKVVGGTAIVTNVDRPARAWFFGDTDGHLRLTRIGNVEAPATVDVRFANAREELGRAEGQVRSYSFAGGESVLIDPEVRHFRIVGVYGGAATVDALVSK